MTEKIYMNEKTGEFYLVKVSGTLVVSMESKEGFEYLSGMNKSCYFISDLVYICDL